MITIKEAVQKAREYAAELYEGETIKNLLLEEAVFDEAEKNWLITLGYDSSRVKREVPSGLASVDWIQSFVHKDTLKCDLTIRMEMAI
jgi:hypothetical protein